MIGIDITAIERYTNIDFGQYKDWSKVYTKKEWEYCFSKPDPAQHLAAIFASKEAIIKAFGKIDVEHHGHIEIDHLESGQPGVILHAPTEATVSLSISHDAGIAVASAMVYPVQKL